jgi:mevalonate kinase
LLAQYCKQDPYKLLEKTFDGSGYDIACATASGPITYQKQNGVPLAQSIEFNPTFKHHLYFIHLGKKQDSREGIKHYRSLSAEKEKYIEQISDLTNKVIGAGDIHQFSNLLEQHESIVADALHLQKVKDQYFADAPLAIKSLGAWGGDFVLAASPDPSFNVAGYFEKKGYDTIIPYADMIL